MNENYFQMIYDEIEQYIQFRWDKIVIYMEYGDTSYTFLFYVKTEGKYIQCYDISGIDEDALLDSFDRIDGFIGAERKKEGQLWSNMTMIVESDGNMQVDYDYSDLSKGAYDYDKEWKKKYLI